MEPWLLIKFRASGVKRKCRVFTPSRDMNDFALVVTAVEVIEMMVTSLLLTPESELATEA